MFGPLSTERVCLGLRAYLFRISRIVFRYGEEYSVVAMAKSRRCGLHTPHSFAGVFKGRESYFWTLYEAYVRANRNTR